MRGRTPLALHLLMCLCLCSSISSSNAVQLILFNNCGYSVWPGVIGNRDHISPNDGGFHLGVHQEAVLDVPNGWSGRIWGRTGCCFDGEGKGSCETGDCEGLLRCGKTSGKPPATVVEMAFGSSSRSPVHFYDVSLVDGFNLPVRMMPVGDGIGCGVAGCEADLNSYCPSRFEVRLQGRIVGCRSACQALRTDRYCCTGEYSSQERCKPTLFSHLFKVICPRAYSFPYDYATSQKACKASHYLITFCPLPF